MSPKWKIAISPGGGGWCFVHLEDPTFRLYVRVEPFKSSPLDPAMRERTFDIPVLYKIVELYVDGDGYILDADYLRTIPLAAIEALINSDEVSEQVQDTPNAPGYIDLKMARQFSHFQKLARDKSKMHKKIDRPFPHEQLIRKIAMSRPEKLDDDFLQRVAQFYAQSLSFNERPIKSLSHAAQVPRETAARWVKLARAKGFLATTRTMEK